MTDNSEQHNSLDINRILQQLQDNLEQRKQQTPEESYVASLHHKGLNKILEKIGEEATEVILAAKDVEQHQTKDDLAKEAADLLFHTFVALSHLDIPISKVFEILGQRLGTSGHAEKASRT